jgi:formate dehydrogenase subunit gamma
MPSYESWSSERAAEIIRQHADRPGATLPILHALQEEFGHVPEEAVPLVAHALNLSRAEVHGVVTFYHDFRRTPPGQHVLKLCCAEACQAMGSDDLARARRAPARRQARRDHPRWPRHRRGNLLPRPVCVCALRHARRRVVGRLDATRLDALLTEVQR